MLVDIAIVLFLVGFVFVGFFRGALRQLLVLGAWFVTFVIAAQGRDFIADYLRAQGPDFSVQYSQMLGFLIAFVVLFVAALAVIQLSGRTVTLSTRPIVEELVGGAVMLVVGVLVLTAVLIALNSYYAQPRAFTAQVSQLNDLYGPLVNSRIMGFVHDTTMPLIQFLLGPLLPPDIRHFG